MPTAHVNGIDIWYERSGGAGPTLVLTHGFAGPTQGWPPVIEDFKKHFDLLLYDVRAHGKTSLGDPEAMTIPQCAADLAGLLDALGIERPYVAGVSMGGMISAQFACDFPEKVKALALCDTVAGNGEGPDDEANEVERYVVTAFERMASLVERYGLAELVARENRYRHESDEYAKLQTFTLEEQDERNRVAKVEHMTREGFLAANRAVRTRPDLTSRTPKLMMPVQVSCGEWDRFYPCAKRDAALIPGRRFITIKGAAHSTESFKPHLWRRAVFDFVADVEAGRPTAGDVTLAD